MTCKLDEVSAFIAVVKEKFEEIKEKLNENDGIVNLKHVDDINDIIAEITEIKNNMTTMLGDITVLENDYLAEYNKYLNEIRRMMEKRGIINSKQVEKKAVDIPHNGDWTVVSKKKNGNTKGAWGAPAPPKINYDSLAVSKSREQLQYTTANVHITDKLYIPNVRTTHSLPPAEKLINSIEPGYMYYSHATDTFFMLVNPGSMLLYGNIGDITPPIDAPSRVKDCKFYPCKHEKCDFYHDPFKYPGRSDRRNYITNSWEYTGAMAGQKRQGEQSRMIGSRSNLEIDLEVVTEPQINIYGSQLMHDILIYMLCKINN